MKLAILAFLIATVAMGNEDPLPPVTWGPNQTANFLTPQIELFPTDPITGSFIISGPTDPTVTATFGTPASLYLDYANGTVYRKNDSGTTTNWTALGSGGGGGSVNSVTASAPLSSSGGANPNISETQANSTTNGWLSSVDWNTFNGKMGGRVTNTVTTTFTVPAITTDYMLNADSSAGAFSVTLPTEVNGLCVSVKNMGSPEANVTVLPAGGTTIDRGASFVEDTLNENEVYCGVNGNWWIQ